MVTNISRYLLRYEYEMVKIKFLSRQKSQSNFLLYVFFKPKIATEKACHDWGLEIMCLAHHCSGGEILSWTCCGKTNSFRYQGEFGGFVGNIV